MKKKKMIKDIIRKRKRLFSILKKTYKLYIFITQEPIIFLFKKLLIYSTLVHYIKYLKHNNNITLFITHSLGGGIEQYLNNIKSSFNNYAILRNKELSKYQQLLYIELPESNLKIYIPEKKIPRLINLSKIISVESLYKYKNIYQMLFLLSNTNVKIKFKLHDYHSICPNQTLTKDGKCCNFIQCQQCNIPDFFYTTDITKWRESWQNFFNNLSEFYCFSNASKQLICSIYNINDNIISVCPHSMEYFITEKITKLPTTMNIGIFGKITSEAKGLNVVTSFIEYMSKQDVNIFLNGTLSNSQQLTKFKNFRDMGKYEPTDLYTRLIKQQIGIVFFPSICPETFSYLVSELIATGIPIVCFNVGAQAEKVIQYKYGEIIQKATNESIYEAIEHCYEKAKIIYNNSTSFTQNKNNEGSSL